MAASVGGRFGVGGAAEGAPDGAFAWEAPAEAGGLADAGVTAEGDGEAAVPAEAADDSTGSADVGDAGALGADDCSGTTTIPELAAESEPGAEIDPLDPAPTV